MRALVCKEYGPPSQLILDDLDDPKPSKGQILIKVKAAGINFPDVLSIEGKYQGGYKDGEPNLLATFQKVWFKITSMHLLFFY